MRDFNKNKEYFDDFIERVSASIERQEKKIRKDRVQSVKKALSESYLRLVSAKYSRGDDVFSISILNDYCNSVRLLKEYWEEEHLNKQYIIKKGKPVYLKQYTGSGFLVILNALSLGVLLNVSLHDFEKIVEFIDNDVVRDFLFEFLIKYKIENRNLITSESYTEFFGVNEKFGALKEITFIKDNLDTERALETFLQNDWYMSLKGLPIYNQHQNEHDTYSGYWCFVSAAIVKIKGLNDQSFRGNKYYPKDLV